VKYGRIGTDDRLILRLNRDGIFLVFQVRSKRWCIGAGPVRDLDIARIT